MTATLLLPQLPATALAATVDDSYTPGTYTGTARGFAGDVTVTVTLENTDDSVAISQIDATGEDETPSRQEKALKILENIKEQNGTDGLAEKLANKEIDAVTKATISAQAIVTATESALSKASAFMSGNGTEAKPYLISTAAQMAAFATAVDNGNSYEGEFVAPYANIDLGSVANWNPIGSEADESNIFNGTFDGQGHTISNWNITDAGIAVRNASAKVYAGSIAGAT